MSKVRILYDFQAEGSNELTAFSGEELYVINANLFDGWIQVKNMRGQEGIVPSTYVEYVESNDDDDIPPPPSSYMNTPAPAPAPTSWDTNYSSMITPSASFTNANYNSYDNSYTNQESNNEQVDLFDSFQSPNNFVSENVNQFKSDLLADLEIPSSWANNNNDNNNKVKTDDDENKMPLSFKPELPSTEPVGWPDTNARSGSIKNNTGKSRHRDSDDDDSDDFDDDGPSNTHSNIGPNRAQTIPTSTSSSTINVATSGTVAKPKTKNPFGLEVFLLHGAVVNVQESDRTSTIIMNEQRQSVWKRTSPGYQVNIIGYQADKKYHGVKKFTSYEIQAKIFPQKVKRRYNHFDWLHKRLVEKFGYSINIPPLPDKAVTGNFEDEFIAKRKAQLELWLNRVSSHPVMGQSEVFIHFLQCDDTSSKWKPGKRKAEKDEYRGAQWYCTLTVPGESVDTVVNIKERIDRFSKAAINFDNCVKNVSFALDKLASYHTNTYKKELVHLGKKLEELGLSLSNDSLEAPNNSLLSTALVTTGNTYTQIGNQYGEQSKIDVTLLMDRLALYRGIAQQMPDIMSFEKSSIQMYEEFQQKQEKLEGRTLMEVAPRREIISHVTFAEINLFNRDKVDDFNLYMRTFLQQQIAFYTEITDCLKRAYANFEKIPLPPQSSTSNQSIRR